MIIFLLVSYLVSVLSFELELSIEYVSKNQMIEKAYSRKKIAKDLSLVKVQEFEPASRYEVIVSHSFLL